MVTTVTDNSPQSINTSLFSLDREVQEVKKTTDALNDKLSGIDTESGVISVNGKQGIVELNASDVDALPSSTVIPTTTSELTNNSGFITINDVGASVVPITRKVNNKSLDKDITLTASDVGALPDTTVIPTKTSQLTNDSGFITSSDSITGNAATATTADKVKNALTVNGKTYDGSAAIDAGVQTIANGGTGQTTQADINKAIVGALEEGTSDVTDGTMFVSSYASDNGFADTNATNVPYKRKFSRVWEYIKGKISSVLGLTASNYGGKAKKATQDADGNVITSTYATKAELENTFQDHLIGYIRNKPIYRKVILDSTAYNVSKADIGLINLGGSNRKFIRSGGYVKYKITNTNYRSYSINSKTCGVEIFDQDGLVFLESINNIVGTNIDIYAWIDYMQF